VLPAAARSWLAEAVSNSVCSWAQSDRPAMRSYTSGLPGRSALSSDEPQARQGGDGGEQDQGRAHGAPPVTVGRDVANHTGPDPVFPTPLVEHERSLP
jgi:hypothetical protein